MTTLLTNPPKRPSLDTDKMVIGQEVLIQQEGPEPQPFVDDPRLIQRAEAGSMSTAEVDLLRFLNEEVEILVYEPQELGGGKEMWYVPLCVDCVTQYVRRGQPQKVKRKYLEVLARARKVGVRAHGFVTGGTEVVNEVHRTSRALEFPFQVLHDPSGPKGTEWLARILREDR